jgi:pimeloyl-ACP methyl ester carboxylesterase
MAHLHFPEVQSKVEATLANRLEIHQTPELSLPSFNHPAMSIAGALNTKIVNVSHLGGTKVSYHLPKAIVGSKPTLILINAFATSASFFRPQVTDAALLDEVNIVAMEPLGHGNTSTQSPQYTFWDSAVAFLQAMDSLGIKKAYVLGSSQGGFMAVRMALLAPARVSTPPHSHSPPTSHRQGKAF